MRLKDYMVGDWIATEHDFPMQITAVGKDYVYADFEGNEGDVFEFGEKYPPKPITLTGDILEANNFKRIIMKNYTDSSCFGVFGECFYYDIKGLGIDIRTSYERIDVRGGFSLIQVRNKKNYACVENLDYVQVHELQHALRLCGLEELATNFKV